MSSNLDRLRELSSQLERAEAKVKIQEQRFKSLVEQMPMSVQTFSPNGEAIAHNEAWERLWAADPDGDVGYNILSDPQVKQIGLLPFIERAFSGETVELPNVFYDPALIGKRGRARHLRGYAYPVKDDLGAILEVVVIHEDFTDLHEAQELLAYTNSLLLAQNDTLLDGILVVGLNGEVKSYNRAFAEMWGIPPKVLNRGTDADALENAVNKVADPDEFLAKVREVYRSQEKESADILELKDGKVFHRYSRKLYVGNKEAGVLWVFRDATELEKRNHELKRANDIYEAIMANIIDLVSLITLDGVITFASPSHIDALGYTAEELIGKNFIDFVHPEDQEKAALALRTALLTEDSVTTKARVKHKNGSWVQIEGIATVIKDYKGRPETIMAISWRAALRSYREALSHE